jgi:hypothetical protein
VRDGEHGSFVRGKGQASAGESWRVTKWREPIIGK